MNKLYILCGIPFAGKTTLATYIAQLPNFIRVDLDDIKFELYSKDIQDEDLEKHHWDIVYQKMYEQIERELRRGKSVIHDTGNFTRYERGLVQEIAMKLSVPFVTIYVDCPFEVAKSRWMKNKITSQRFDISEKSFLDACAEMEQPADKENSIAYSQKDSVEEWVRNNIQV